MVTKNEQVTPTEYLTMEVLAARHRLGESVWTFPGNGTGALYRLSVKGLVGYKSGGVEKTVLAWLTDEGIKAWKLDQPYPPESVGGQA